ncbi:MAG: imidazole glycerol phosphate synthase subunit HisF [Candidatus Omnitrophota bacterium]|nr:MAG: imidazole glycerol phosphate synthase subunit HisF [Candidatus Omnitrophota bacterium]
MRNIRIIPRLDVKGPNLVKGIHLEGLRVLGSPEYFAKRYYEQGADELIYMDIVATLYGRNNLKEIVERTAKDVFIPITVGGGIRSIEDIRILLRAGADKIAINTAAIQNPDLIREGAETFGSQCIVLYIEAKEKLEGNYEAFTDNAREETGVDVFEWAYRAYQLGAGEILVTSIDRDGTGEGYDVELISKISNTVPIPVVASGGAGKLDDIIKIIESTNVSAVAAASLFHYSQIDKGLARCKYEEGNTEFLKTYAQIDNYRPSRIKPISIFDLKSHMKKAGIIDTRVAELHSCAGLKEEESKNIFIRSFKNRPSVAVIDYDCGNLFNITSALKNIDADFQVTDNAKIVAASDKLILPGVGSFESGINNLERRGLITPIKEHAKKGKPIFGICLGMQLLMTEGEEYGSYKGLDLIKGRVTRIPIDKEKLLTFKIPHIGWNKIKLPQQKAEVSKKAEKGLWHNSILKNVLPGSLMYFVHSYIVISDSPEWVLAETEYGGRSFCSAIQKDNVYGCQFHPERSREVGLDIYRQFVFVGIGGKHE